MTLFADVAAASTRVAATSARSEKVAILAALLSGLEPDEVAIATGVLAGVPRQGRIGVGYVTAFGVEHVPADSPSLGVRDVDRAIAELASAAGPGSAAGRRRLLLDLLGRATAEEAELLRRLFTGELRQGALAGVMVDAV